MVSSMSPNSPRGTVGWSRLLPVDPSGACVVESQSYKRTCPLLVSRVRLVGASCARERDLIPLGWVEIWWSAYETITASILFNVFVLFSFHLPRRLFAQIFFSTPIRRSKSFCVPPLWFLRRKLFFCRQRNPQQPPNCGAPEHSSFLRKESTIRWIFLDQKNFLFFFFFFPALYKYVCSNVVHIWMFQKKPTLLHCVQKPSSFRRRVDGADGKHLLSFYWNPVLVSHGPSLLFSFSSFPYAQ